MARKHPDDPIANLRRAKQLRENQTPPEIVFWSRVRAHRLHGLKFRRQHPIGPYVADFYCAEAAMVIELDGRTHRARIASDRARDEWMHRRGILVVRASVSKVSKNPDVVAEAIGRMALRRIADRRAMKE
jgi:very-short-patch-repair endonuclease